MPLGLSHRNKIYINVRLQLVQCRITTPFCPPEQYVVPNLTASLLQYLGILYFQLVLL